MKKYLLCMVFALIWPSSYLLSSVTYQQLQVAINQRNGDQLAFLTGLVLTQSNRLCVFQGLASLFIDLAVPLRFTSCTSFSNNPSGCYNNDTFFCDSSLCCTYTAGDPIIARAIDILLLVCVEFEAYEVLKFLLTEYSYATVNIDNISDQWTLLMIASDLDNLSIAKLLLSYGADITACSNTGLSAIDLAQANASQNMINLLLYTEQKFMNQLVNT